MKRILAATLAAILALPAFPAGASAGLVMEVVTRGPGDAKKETSSTLQLESDRLSVRNNGMRAIFRADQDLVWVIQEKDREFMELTGADAREVGEPLSAMRAEIEKGLASLPPDQRAMAEKLMQGREAAAWAAADTAASLSYHATGKTETIHGYVCRSYDILQGDQRVSQAWVADWKDFDVTLADFQVMTDFSAFLKKLAVPLAKEFEAGIQQAFTAAGLPGVPVRTVTTTSRGQLTVELRKVAHAEVAAEEFEVPAGFKRGAPFEEASEEGKGVKKKAESER